MKSFDYSKAEEERLLALNAIGILDTKPEEIYQDTVELAGLVCDTPVALISLVDRKRQWFKAKKGIEICESPREISFCTHAIQQSEPLIISDASTDPRFSSNSFVLNAPYFKFYAGFPLTLKNGQNIGTLCVLDTVAKILTQKQIESLKILARQVVAHFEHRMHEAERSRLLIEIDSQRLLAANSAKMASLGIMAAGIAHEINNPLAVILAWSSELESAANRDEIDKDQLKKISNSIERVALRISKTVKALRSFARDGTSLKIEPCRAQSILEETLELCKSRFADHGIKLEVKIPPEDFMIQCRGVEVSQVLLNLLNNSFDAVSNLPEKWVKCDFKSDLDKVEIIIQDSGLCPPLAIREKMMSPFFTTKATGQGTGLGLSISQRIAQSHGGSLVLVPEKHTKFVLTLPKVRLAG